MHASITSALTTVCVLLFGLFVLLPSQANAFPLSLPTINGLHARSPVANPTSDKLDFSRLLTKRKGSKGGSSSGGKKKKISSGAIAGIVIAIIVIIIIVCIFLYLRRRKARGH
ncbi:MAG: hypothetical protein M1833_006012 [Piccolia ochrophora]|nr:MAG: hypothetical protein M1833_006012 [Piccolia ochrophora]